MRINVYVPNLPQRKDRKKEILQQFRGKDIFSLNLVTPIPHEKGYISLWKTFINIVNKEYEKDSELFIFGEDDHVFTENYSPSYLLEQIEKAKELNADILSGGVSWMRDPIACTEHLFWLHKYNGNQFIVVFRKFYERLLNIDREDGYITDYRISEESNYIFVVYPFISRQKEFGYSDVTASNGKQGYVEGLFNGTEEKLRILSKVRYFYQNLS